MHARACLSTSPPFPMMAPAALCGTSTRSRGASLGGGSRCPFGAAALIPPEQAPGPNPSAIPSASPAAAAAGDGPRPGGQPSAGIGVPAAFAAACCAAATTAAGGGPSGTG